MRSSGLHPAFFVMVADEAQQAYTLFLELARGDRAAAPGLAERVDGELAASNLEYRGKRDSGRLPAPKLVWLRRGAAEAYKSACVRAGQREGQYKPAVLVYLRELKLSSEALAGLAEP